MTTKRLRPPWQHRLASLAGLFVASVARPAFAFEGDVGTNRVQVDVTEASSVLYNADNRNSRPGDVSRRIDDDWGVWYNRLNAQASTGNWNAGLRLDSALFYSTPNPTDLGLGLLRDQHGGTLPSTYSANDANFFVLKTTEASRELSTRYTDWLYPSKYYVGYSGRVFDATFGDFYAQLGRGFVLSVRKLDELASDTTIRGARATAHFHDGSFRLRVTGLAGVFNPLRIDEASGRYLGVTRDVTPGIAAATEAGMPRAQASPFDAVASPTYAPDRVVGAQIEGGTRVLQLGVQGAIIDRSLFDPTHSGTEIALNPGVTRSAETLRVASASLEAPDLDGHGSAYFEAAVQSLSYPSGFAGGTGNVIDDGYALYGSLTAEEKPVTLTAEVKHYRRFFPLAANVDLARAPEFSALQYNAPPTTEAFWVDTEFENLNTCVSGGRLKADVAVGENAMVFAWAGRYLTWAESAANEACHTSRDNLNRIWDLATGFELRSRDGRSRATLTAGTRVDDTDRLIADANGGQTHVFYTEAFGRYEILAWLGGPWSLNLQGWDRRRRQTQGGLEEPWTELTQVVAVGFAPRLTMGGSFEYTSNPEFPPTYVSGTLGYNLSSSSNITLFAGQRRGGLRCVSGVCRVYPPFEGVRLDATFRF